MNEHERSSASQIAAAPQLLVIAHRGASQIAPENTLPAFRAALQLGVDLVELDYRHSADDVPVVFHDDQLDRTTDAARLWQQARVPLADHSLDQLRKLDAGSWFSPQFAKTRIPSLVEALRLITPQAIALVERKAGSAQACVDLLRSHGFVERVIVQSFDWGFLADCRRLAPDLALAALGEKQLTAAALNEIARMQIPVIAWDHEHVTPELVSTASSRGLSTWTWTVDDPRRMSELTAWGVRGIITNRPDLLLSIRDGAAT